ncbi:YbgA family protein [Thermodesulfobacteriota bacterium]
MEKIHIGVSACLLGEAVRYDGGHALDRYITGTLGKYMELVPVCPEVEASFGVPREPLRLVGDTDSPRLITVNTKKDLTNTMMVWARRRVKELEKEDLCGFIFKSKSPSSGMERVKVYPHNSMPVKKGIGLFARTYMEHFPLIPVEEEGRLHDPHLRENFIERIFTLDRWRNTLKGKKSPGRLVNFHTLHKLLILSHSTQHYREMGRLVAQIKGKRISEVYAHYETILMEALRLKATVKRHTNVLQHIMGYFKKQLTVDEKQELLEVIKDFNDGLIPLIAPITLFKHYMRKYEQPYLKDQVYLSPHPVELKLRNHV